MVNLQNLCFKDQAKIRKRFVSCATNQGTDKVMCHKLRHLTALEKLIILVLNPSTYNNLDCLKWRKLGSKGFRVLAMLSVDTLDRSINEILTLTKQEYLKDIFP